MAGYTFSTPKINM